jgi:hypothetical protein
MSAPALTEAERAEVIDWAKACEGHAIADGKPEGPIRNVSGLAACRAGLVAYVESLVVTRVPVVEPIPAPVQPETVPPLVKWAKDQEVRQAEVERLAHRMALHYKHDADPARVQYTFNAATLAQFVRAVSGVQPQAEPVECDYCSGHGMLGNRIDDAVTCDYCGGSGKQGAAPVAQADSAMLDWLERHDGEFHNIDRIASIVGTGFLTGPLSTSRKHQTLRAAILAAMKGTP